MDDLTSLQFIDSAIGYIRALTKVRLSRTSHFESCDWTTFCKCVVMSTNCYRNVGKCM